MVTVLPMYQSELDVRIHLGRSRCNSELSNCVCTSSRKKMLPKWVRKIVAGPGRTLLNTSSAVGRALTRRWEQSRCCKHKLRFDRAQFRAVEDEFT